MLNKVILHGRLCETPTMGSTATGKDVSSFSIAVGRNYKEAGGEYGVDFIRCVAFGALAAHISKYYVKGQEILITGRLTVRKYQKDDETRYAYEVTAEGCDFAGRRMEPATYIKEEEADELPF